MAWIMHRAVRNIVPDHLSFQLTFNYVTRYTSTLPNTKLVKFKVQTKWYNLCYTDDMFNECSWNFKTYTSGEDKKRIKNSLFYRGYRSICPTHSSILQNPVSKLYVYLKIDITNYVENKMKLLEIRSCEWSLKKKPSLIRDDVVFSIAWMVVGIFSSLTFHLDMDKLLLWEARKQTRRKEERMQWAPVPDFSRFDKPKDRLWGTLCCGGYGCKSKVYSKSRNEEIRSHEVVWSENYRL